MSEHRFSNSARTRQQVIANLAQYKMATKQPTEINVQFRGVDWLLGKRKTFLVPVGTSTKPETLIRYARLVLYQQGITMRRLFWLAIVVSGAVGIAAGAVGAAMLLVK